MRIGSVIKKYRKEKGLTQEEMASRLGVTAPAVNKWEKGNSLPDVALIAPIARLLGITTDELLSFRETLTDEEINQYLMALQQDLECKDFRDVFLAVKETIQEYPNCEMLIWQAAALLDGKRQTAELPDGDDYENTLLGWYERCLSSEDERVRNQAADSLFYAYVRREDYEKAACYLDYLSLENPERKRKAALVNSKTGKRVEAYRAYEELLFTGYQHTQQVLNDLRILYMEDGDHEMARKLAGVSSAAASAFEMGRYHEVCSGLDVAVWERDVAWTAEVMRDILESVDTLGDFAKSGLYQHMQTKPLEPENIAAIRQMLLQSLNDETYGYMRGDEAWERLKAGALQ